MRVPFERSSPSVANIDPAPPGREEPMVGEPAGRHACGAVDPATPRENARQPAPRRAMSAAYYSSSRCSMGRAFTIREGTRRPRLLEKRRPGRLSIRLRRIRQTSRITAVGIHHVNLPVAIALRRKRDLRAIGRPGGPEVGGTVLRQSLGVRAVGVDHVDFRVAVAT